MKLSKRAFLYNYFIGVITLVLSFFLLINFLGDSSNFLSDELQDNACRSTVVAKGNTLIKVAEIGKSIGSEKKIFEDINYHCREDQITDAGSDSREEVYEQVSDLMQRCWYRYGEGEVDFMQNIGSTGNWCFTCAKLEFEDGEESYSFLDFAEWSLQEGNTVEVDDEEMLLGEYLQLKYSDIETDTYIELEDQIDEIRELAQDPAFQSLYYYMVYEKNYLADLAMKEIDTTDTNYIVFRYDRLQEDAADVFVNIGVGILAGLAVEAAAEAAVTWGFGAIVSIPKAVIKGVTSASTIASAQDKVSTAISTINTAKKTTRAGKVLKLDSVTDVLSTGSRVDIAAFADDIKQYDEFKDYGRALDDIVKVMDDVNVDNFDDLTKLDNFEALTLTKKQELVKAIKDMDNVNDKAAVKAANNQLDVLDSDLANFEDIRRRVQAIDEGNPIIDPTTLENMGSYLRFSSRGVAGAVGGITGASFSNEYEQYVDVLDKEQYYRLCGTSRFDN